MIAITWHPDRRRLRRFGLAALVALAALGAWVYVRHGLFGFGLAESTAGSVAFVLWEAAAVCGLAAAFLPALLRPLYLVLTMVGLPIGWVISHVALAVVFYVVLTPIGVVMRLLGRDPLHRRFESDARTYWVRRRPPADPKRYFRQF